MNHIFSLNVSRLLLAALLAIGSSAAAALDLGRLQPQEVAVYVQDLDSGQVLLEHRADASMNPASTMKLVTAFAALRGLGSDYRWQTEWRSQAPVSGGALQGDLYWVGSGNPVFDQPDLLAMQQQLAAQGIGSLNGRVVLDRSVWPHSGSAEGFAHDESEAFVTPPDPHMVAYKVLWVTAGRDAGGNPAFELNPPLPGVPVDTLQVAWSGGRCSRLTQHVSAVMEGERLVFKGRLPSACVGEKMFVNVFDAPRFAEDSFRGHWLAQGFGGLYGFSEGKAPAQSRVLAVNQSRPLAEVLTDMNKFSNNLIARTVFLTLGQREAGSGGLNAEAAVRRQLVSAGVDDETLVLENGSGLSRRERASARLLGQMLYQAYRSPFRQDFVRSLPVAGVDGTLKTRFRNLGSPLRLKTGTLRDVRALAGYWLPERGRRLALVVIINSPRSDALLPDLDALVNRIVREAAVQP